MKFYESHYEEYITTAEQADLHPELETIRKSFPQKLSQFGNLIIYGPSGVGKYSQMLRFIKKYSPSDLKYEKKITTQTEKQQYIYKISDIHYEIDMSLLGCNSKILWHEVFSQIVDIVSMKNDKNGIIVCKNFHSIHNELLEIFYSYMQQYNHPHLNVQIKFILITEHVSFLPNSILNNSRIISIKRPEIAEYTETVFSPGKTEGYNNIRLDPQLKTDVQLFNNTISNPKQRLEINYQKIKQHMMNMEADGLLNIKEIRSFSLINKDMEFPKDAFNTICNSIINIMIEPEKIVITEFRDIIYDILIYNLDAIECLWYIISHFINIGWLKGSDISDVLEKTHTFLKYYNNNYRPIYHLESIFFYIINKVHHYK
jgi:hypothetical protein